LVLKKYFGRLKRVKYVSSFLFGEGRLSSLKSLIFILGMIIFISFPAAAQTPAERQASLKGKLPFKVAVLPVTIHSPENLDFMRAGLLDMLSSRIELEGRVSVLEKGAVKKALPQAQGEMDIENARKIGHELGVDFVVFGSLTKLGDSASLDLKVLEIKEEKPPSSVFVQANKMEEIIARVDDLARKVDEKILGYPLSPPVAEKTGERPREMAGIPAPPIGFQPPVPARIVAGGEFWQSQPFPIKIKGMAVGDLDGDGLNEVALIDERHLWIYRWEKTEFRVLRKFDGARLDKYLAVDVGDIDKDGKAEIFVTNIQGERLSSFVVAFKDGAFRKVATNLDWFLRVVEWGERGPVLLGQQKGYKAGFEWPIYEMGWDGKRYKEIRKAEIPKVFSIYGFTPFIRDGKTEYIFIDSNFQLKLMDEKGKVVWRGKDDYGSDIEFQTKPLVVGPGQRFEDADEWAYVNVRVIPKGKEILIIRNISATGQFFRRGKSYTKGEVQVLTWTGALFMVNWKSREIPGYLADFQFQDVDGEKGKELIVAVILPKESFFSGESNSALMVSRVEGIQ